jgi:uncharacterized repeat protein (TIGR01451 family)
MNFGSDRSFCARTAVMPWQRSQLCKAGRSTAALPGALAPACDRRPRDIRRVQTRSTGKGSRRGTAAIPSGAPGVAATTALRKGFQTSPGPQARLTLSGSADLYLKVQPSPAQVTQGGLLTYAFPMWNLGPANADHAVLTTQVPAGTTFDFIRISGTPGLGTCTTPPYQGTGQIVCNENSSMAPNTTWTVRLTVKVTAPSGTVIIENAATMADTPDPNLANNTATVSTTVQ